MEERRLLSVVTAALNNGQLVVSGSEKADTIDVRQVGSAPQVDYSTVDAAGNVIDSGQKTFTAALVNKITVNGGLGADTLSFVDPNTPSRFAVKLDGGSGFDPTVLDMIYAKDDKRNRGFPYSLPGDGRVCQHLAALVLSGYCRRDMCARDCPSQRASASDWQSCRGRTGSSPSNKE